MTYVLAFDVSETLQVARLENDGLGTLNEVAPEFDDGLVTQRSYSVLHGGVETARLIQKAQALGILITLVTNNGSGGAAQTAEDNARTRTLSFLTKYGITISPENYYSPADGNKVASLNEIMQKHNIEKSQILFFDDAGANIRAAQAAGFETVRVRDEETLQQGIRAFITKVQLTQQKAQSIRPSQDSASVTRCRMFPNSSSVPPTQDEQTALLGAEKRKDGCCPCAVQ